MTTHTMTDEGSVCGKKAMKEERVLEITGMNAHKSFPNNILEMMTRIQVDFL